MQKKDTLVIIGNGFDIWQNLNTSYADFQAYYLKHRDEILKKLKNMAKSVVNANRILKYQCCGRVKGPYEVKWVTGCPKCAEKVQMPGGILHITVMQMKNGRSV